MPVGRASDGIFGKDRGPIMTKLILKLTVVLALVDGTAAVLSIAEPAIAKSPPCRSDEMAIPDDRGGGKKLCLKKSEWAKARKICLKNGSKDPMGCICQDGLSVGACGD
jgi:hypothetical protein